MWKNVSDIIIIHFESYWEYKLFALGADISSFSGKYFDRESTKRDYYICLHLGFWKLSIGIKI